MADPTAAPETPGGARRLILGLGNPGAAYAATRHNVGFRVVAELARRWGERVDHLECGALVGKLEASARGGPETLLALPQTFMNRSGYAARCLLERHRLEPAGVLVVYDEINLPLGRLRLRRSGSPAGHRGMESVIENLRTVEVPRLRLGIAGAEPTAGADFADFVLAPFAPEETAAAEEMIRRAADACEVWRQEGPEAAMQRFN
jgi:peptidyl-tRNA hydrolase, PTH1 family